jgi:hypothetical protein
MEKSGKLLVYRHSPRCPSLLQNQENENNEDLSPAFSGPFRPISLPV